MSKLNITRPYGISFDCEYLRYKLTLALMHTILIKALKYIIVQENIINCTAGASGAENHRSDTN